MAGEDYNTQIAVTLVDKTSKEYTEVGNKLIAENNKVNSSMGQMKSSFTQTQAAANGYTTAVSTATKTTADAVPKNNSLMTSVKGVVGAYLGWQGIRMATQFLRASAQEAVTADQAFARLGAVLHATGKDSEMSAAGLDKMAKQLQKTTIYEDDAIIAAQSMLLEFDNLGADVLPRATKAILDLGTRTGDLNGATLMIGKALQGEEGSLTALRRTGIVFNDEQQKMITNLLETGRAGEAAAIILGKVESRVGGAAEAMANTPSGKYIQALNDMKNAQEDLGKSMIPLITAWDKVLAGAIKGASYIWSKAGRGGGVAGQNARDAAEAAAAAAAPTVLPEVNIVSGTKRTEKQIAAEKKLADEKIARDLYNEQFEVDSFNRLEKWKQDKRKDAVDQENKEKDALLDADRRRTEEYYRLEDEKAKARSDGITQGVNDLETLAKANRKFGLLYKAGAITEAIIEGQKAAIKAWGWGVGWGGPILGGIAAATSIGATGAHINAIREQKFAQGGFVQGGSTSGDREWVRANAGEGIITTGQQRRLMDILDGRAGAGASPITFSPIITINGATDANATAAAVGKTVQEAVRDFARMQRRTQTALV